MLAEAVLALWSGAGLLWWSISWRLVVAARKPVASVPAAQARKWLTIFKPLPPLAGKGLQVEARGLESFIAQSDDLTELLLGVHEADWPDVLPFVQRMEAAYPDARVVVVRRSDADTVANPKIAWQKILVPQAKGDLWLWSDADIVAPPDFLTRARAEFESCGAKMLTFPYAVRALPHPSALLDALFVNAEFYPGVLLLRWFGPVDFGLGSAMLFLREDFLREVCWEELGAALADDFALGQMLQPIRLSTTTLETVADAADWPAALAHYFRWKKTVCWCRPIGFASQVIILPLLGWLALVCVDHASLGAWVGLLAMMQIDVVFAVLICREIGCPLNLAAFLGAEAWAIDRPLFWIFCWLPLPVFWREKVWPTVRKSHPNLI